MIRQLSTALSCAIVFGLSQVALALDCGKARTPVETAICADPKAQAAEDALSEAYRAIAAGLDVGQRAGLVASQRKWLRLRDMNCTGSRAAIVACVIDDTQHRVHYLRGTAETGPGPTGKLMPVIVQAPERQGYYDLNVNALKFAAPSTPGETLFNAQVDALLKRLPSPTQRQASDLPLEYDLDMALTYAAADLLSARYQTYDFSGGAHGSSLTRHINIDMTKGALLTFDALFIPAALDTLRNVCLAQVTATKKTRQFTLPLDDMQPVATVEKTLLAFDHWALTPGNATVNFDAYDLGSFAEGPYSCTFDAALLRPLLKPGAHLP